MNVVVIILSVIAGAAVLGITVYLISRKRLRLRMKALLLAGTVTAEAVAACAVYVNIYYKADETALKYLKGEEGLVSVSDTPEGYLFDGPGTSQALIFYPGGKVESEAYSPLLCRIAERGVDCILVDMPLRLAFLDMNAADRVIERHEYSSYAIAGHSLGGVAAANYASSNEDKLDALILLAAYSVDPISQNLDCLSVYGSSDQVLNMSKLHTCAVNLPDDTVTLNIKGGNHCQFGSYGFQSGDGEAAVSENEQWDRTAEAVVSLLEKRSA